MHTKFYDIILEAYNKMIKATDITSYSLSACYQAVGLLVPICNVLILLDVKKKAENYFLPPQSMFVMHILAYLKPNFEKYCLKLLDIDVLVIDVIVGRGFLNKGSYNRVSHSGGIGGAPSIP